MLKSSKPIALNMLKYSRGGKEKPDILFGTNYRVPVVKAEVKLMG